MVHSCRIAPFGVYKTEYVWILTRKPLDPIKNEKEFNRIKEKAISII